ncbi:MAG: Gfo/Idh/MocA family oxidoreductase, partial [Deinococcus sp.]|nr:Gfo/Idh/MocA family oxidoreductase [Deinococcus sp.]
MQLKVGIVGTGWWVEHAYLPALALCPEATVTALCGHREERTKALAAKAGIKGVFTDYQQFLQADCDIVCVVTPNRLHREQVLGAARAGKHIICEKPLGLNLAEAREMYAAVQATQVKHLTMFTWREIPAFAYLQELIANGYVGWPRYVNTMRLEDYMADPQIFFDWRWQRSEAGSGALGDLGPHVFDQVRYLLGEFTGVFARTDIYIPQRPMKQKEGLFDVTNDDVCSAVFLQGDKQGAAQISRIAAGRHNYQRIEVHGDKQGLVFEYELGDNWRGDLAWATGRLYGGPMRGKLGELPIPQRLIDHLSQVQTPDHARTHYVHRLIKRLLAAIRDGGDASPSLLDGVKAQEVVAAAEISAAAGR